MAQGTCLMTGQGHVMPCSAASCPLFGDCLVQYEKEQKNVKKTLSNEAQLKAMPKNELAQTIHAFSLGFAPWCDYHCKNRGDDGCDQCIQAWLDRPAEETKVPTAAVLPIGKTEGKHGK